MRSASPFFKPYLWCTFTVNSERQMWHCFGCNKGGDVFSFLMEIDKVTFPEALAVLAERAGIELPTSGRGAGDGKRDRLYQANALANDFFRASLREPGGAKARAYLAGRGFDDAILDRFQVGWAPEGWDSLSAALGKLLPPTVLEEAGLLLRRENGTHYDRFVFSLGTTSDGAGKPSNDMTDLHSGGSVHSGRWYHVAGTYDGRVMRLLGFKEPASV